MVPTPRNLILHILTGQLTQKRAFGTLFCKKQEAPILSSLGVEINVDNTQFFWTGRSLEKPRPLIVKLRNQEEKAEILFKAKRLKNNQDWPGVSITHDLTKQQCHAEKVEETQRRRPHQECGQRPAWRYIMICMEGKERNRFKMGAHALYDVSAVRHSMSCMGAQQ